MAYQYGHPAHQGPLYTHISDEENPYLDELKRQKLLQQAGNNQIHHGDHSWISAADRDMMRDRAVKERAYATRYLGGVQRGDGSVALHRSGGQVANANRRALAVGGNPLVARQARMQGIQRASDAAYEGSMGRAKEEAKGRAAMDQVAQNQIDREMAMQGIDADARRQLKAFQEMEQDARGIRTGAQDARDAATVARSVQFASNVVGGAAGGMGGGGGGGGGAPSGGGGWGSGGGYGGGNGQFRSDVANSDRRIKRRSSMLDALREDY